jgi:hypothetical protein
LIWKTEELHRSKRISRRQGFRKRRNAAKKNPAHGGITLNTLQAELMRLYEFFQT